MKLSQSLGRVVAQGLEPLAGGRLTGAHALLDLAFGRGVTLGLLARGHGLEAVLVLDLPHQAFLARVVVPVADHLAVKADAVGQDVDVFVRGVGVAADDVLMIREAHAVQDTPGRSPAIARR